MADPWEKKQPIDQDTAAPTAPAQNPAYPPQNISTAPYQQSGATTPYPQTGVAAPYPQTGVAAPYPQTGATAPYPQPETVAPGTTPYPQQPYPPQGPGGTGPTVEQPPPPYPGPPQSEYQQQPYPQPYPPQAGFQQPYPPPGGGEPTKAGFQQVPQSQPNVVVVNNTSTSQQAPGQTVIVRTVQDLGPEPNNYLVLSILSIFCCFVCGIIAIIYSVRVSSLWARGQQAEARSSASTARGFAIASIVTGCICIFINIIMSMI